MNPMPNKDPTLWAAMLAWLMDNWPAVYGALLALAIAFLRITYAGGRGRRRLIESLLCGLITLAAATGTHLLRIPRKPPRYWVAWWDCLGSTSSATGPR